MSLAERGAYIDLLCVQWLEGEIPLDPELARRAVNAPEDGWPTVWARVSRKFPGGRNAKLERVRDEKHRYHEAKRKAGQKGGRVSAKRRRDGSTATVLPQAKVKPASASASATSTKVSEIPSADADEKWNDRLAPLCRTLNEKGVANWLRWCKGQDVNDCERWLIGLAELRDSGKLSWIPPDTPVKPAVFQRFPELRSQCETAYYRILPSRLALKRLKEILS